jgi:outer membrane protein OmpA-like peptidoglycan-associated protein
MKGKAGYIFPMILFASLAVGLLVLTLAQFQSSNRQKYQHLNDYQAAFNIAYSALVEVLADVQSRQWSNRSFKAGPKDLSANLFGGSYNLRVEDHASIEFMFNVKIRVKFKEKSHLFYWRMQYNPSLLDFTNLFIPVYYEEYGDPANVPSDIDSKVDDIMQRRKDNQPKVEEIADRLRTGDTVKEALEVVGIDPGGVNQADLPRPGIDTITMPPINLPLKPVSTLISAVDPAASHVIKSFQFGTEVSALTEAQKELLNALADVLRDRPDTRIILRGHTDTVGDAAYNMQLSIERAESVADYLIGEGISSSRMTVRGYGETQPIASNETPEGKAKNRRVEFVLKEDP